MRGISERPQLTSLFGNDVLDRLERLRIKPLRRLTSRSHGEHLSGKGGSSTEFSDYRDYVPGDDVRFVDWNIFARLNRPYLKLFQMEEEMHVLLLIDASASMGFEGKLLRAKQLAAAFGLMGLMGGERVSVVRLQRAAGRAGALPADQRPGEPLEPAALHRAHRERRRRAGRGRHRDLPEVPLRARRGGGGLGLPDLRRRRPRAEPALQRGHGDLRRAGAGARRDGPGPDRRRAPGRLRDRADARRLLGQ